MISSLIVKQHLSNALDIKRALRKEYKVLSSVEDIETVLDELQVEHLEAKVFPSDVVEVPEDF